MQQEKVPHWNYFTPPTSPVASISNGCNWRQNQPSSPETFLGDSAHYLFRSAIREMSSTVSNDSSSEMVTACLPSDFSSPRLLRRVAAGGHDMVPQCFCSNKVTCGTARDDKQQRMNEDETNIIDEPQDCQTDWQLPPTPQSDVMFQQLASPQFRKITADLLVKVRGQTFCCHRVILAHFSRYFYNLMNQRQGKLYVEICLKEICPESFAAIYEWMYTSQLCLDQNNLLDVFHAAQFLEIPEVIVICLESLNKLVLEPDKLLCLYAQCIQMGRPAAAEHILRLVALVVTQVAHLAAFDNLNIEAILILLSSNNLNVKSEKEAFQIAVKWLQNKIETRRHCVVDVMSTIRFGQMTEKELFECLHDAKAVDIMAIPECKLMILNGYLCITSKSMGNSDQYPHLCPPPRRSLFEEIKSRGDAYCAQETCDEMSFSKPKDFERVPPPPASIQPKPNVQLKLRMKVPPGKFSNYHLCDCNEQQNIFPGSATCVQSATCFERTSPPPCLPQREERPKTPSLNLGDDSCRCVKSTWPKWWAKKKEKIKWQNETPFDFNLQCPAIMQAECLLREFGSGNAVNTTNRMSCGGENYPRPKCSPKESTRFCHAQSPQRESKVIQTTPTVRFFDNPWPCQERVTANRKLEKKTAGKVVACPVSDCEPDLLQKKPAIMLLGGLNPLDSWSSPSAGKNMYLYKHACTFGKIEGLWKKCGELPSPRHHAAAAFLSGCVYVSGGCCPAKSNNGRNIESLCSVFRLTMRTSKWDQMADMLHHRIHHGFAAVEGNLLAVGGQDETGRILQSVELYCTYQNQWTEVCPLSSPRMGLAVAVSRGILWVCGGMAIKDNDKPPSITKLVECYDIKNNRWTAKNHLRFPRCFASLVDYNGFLHLIGGVTRVSSHKDGIISSVASVDVHDYHTDEWSFKTALQVPRHSAATVVYDRRLFVIGGITSLEVSALECVECYNDARNGWEKRMPHLPIPLSGVAAVVTDIFTNE